MKKPQIPLSENHRRIVGSSLRYAEDQILFCRRLLTETSENRMTRFADEYSDDQIRALVELCDELHEKLVSFADRAGVSPAERSVSRHVSGIMSSIWETLEDLRPRKLRAYGDVPADAARELEPIVEDAVQIIERVLDFSRRCASSPDSGAEPRPSE
ncbi:MAG: hypothetical protein BWY06_01420 [Candidatus Latescibacteria bacterium ADurb.Bin168]|nr:MAG: hypothetical protein BWY06_01420 [Candidatus Latescibacteria bacterium ADurb.Bin168]